MRAAGAVLSASVAVLVAACGVGDTDGESDRAPAASATRTSPTPAVVTDAGPGDAEGEATPDAASPPAPTPAPVTEHTRSVVDARDRPILVFGNSVDANAGHGDEYRHLAWPAQLERRLEARDDLSGVTVFNESQPGATVVAEGVWGDEPNLRLITHVPEVVARYSEDQRATMIVLLAPSLIDLQFNGTDADATASGVADVVDVLDDAGVGTTLVLPMNPVSESIDDIVDLNNGVAEVNRLLFEAGLLATASDRSPLMVAGSSDGDRRFYDDYPGRDLEGNPVGADGLHVDEEGHRVLAAAVETLVADALRAPTGTGLRP